MDLFQTQQQLPFILSSPEIEKKTSKEVNPRNAGRQPEDFFALFKSFICARYMDIDVNSRTICSLLNSNPAFLERMNFKNNLPPSYRTIDRFDQIMTEYDLWERASYISIRLNINEQVIDPQQECAIIVDTTCKTYSLTPLLTPFFKF